MPRLQVFLDDYGDRGFVPLCVNLWQTWDVIKTYTRMYQYPVLRDGGGVWNAYKINSYIPLNYVIDTAGVVLYCAEGFSESTIRGYIEGALPPVGVEEGKTLLPAPAVTATPNPTNGPVTIRFEQAAGQPVDVCVYSSTGTLVRTFESQGSVRWDLTDGSGRRVENGLYFAEVTTAAGSAQVKFSVLPSVRDDLRGTAGNAGRSASSAPA